MTQDKDSVISDELHSWIGRTTPLRPLESMSSSDIRRYIDATGDANPLWLDDEFARSQGHRGRLLPPTLVAWEPFSSRGRTGSTDFEGDDLLRQLPLPANYTDTRNAGTEIDWLRPVYLGESLSAQTCIMDIVARQGKAGVGIYVTREEQILNSNKEIVLRRRQTTVRLPRPAAPDKARDQGSS